MSTLGQSMASAMAQATQGAAIGHAMGAAKDAAVNAIELTHQWAAYAKGLESEIQDLKHKLKNSDLLVTSLKLENNELKANRHDLALKYNVLVEKYNTIGVSLSDGHKTIATLKDDKHFVISDLKKNVEYGKRIKLRLQQMEKSLRHSSADKESLRAMLKPYELLVERLNLQGELPADLQQKAEGIWEKFMNGEELTADDDIQKILDEAPMPERGYAYFRTIKCYPAIPVIAQAIESTG